MFHIAAETSQLLRMQTFQYHHGCKSKILGWYGLGQKDLSSGRAIEAVVHVHGKLLLVQNQVIVLLQLR
jgi:hypothetical protein